MVDFRLFIALRHLIHRKRLTLISVITGIAIGGITVGVALLIVVMSVLNGFFDVVRDLLVSFEPHIRIESASGDPLAYPDSLLLRSIHVPEVTAAYPFVEGKALLDYQSSAEANKVVIVRGLDVQQPAVENLLRERLVLGTTDLGRHENGLPGILISSQLGNRLGLFPEALGRGTRELALLSAEGMEQMLVNPFAPSPFLRFEIRGWYEVEGIQDESYVFVDLAEAQRLFRMSGAVTGFELRMQDSEQAATVKAVLLQHLPEGRYHVETWYDRHRALYRVMRMEKWGAVAILTLIILVAGFNIVGSLTMVTIEKRRDIGILQAMGVSRKEIRQIFLLEGFLIGGTGTILGLIIGLFLVWLQATYHIVPLLSAEAFIIDAYPVSLQLTDVFIVSLLALLLATLASLYPALRAASIEPIRVIQEGAT